jgi:hypothetical protein
VETLVPLLVLLAERIEEPAEHERIGVLQSLVGRRSHIVRLADESRAAGNTFADSLDHLRLRLPFSPEPQPSFVLSLVSLTAPLDLHKLPGVIVGDYVPVLESLAAGGMLLTRVHELDEATLKR